MEAERRSHPILGALTIAARVVVGVTFIVLGARKLADPVAFLKAIREYQLVPDSQYLVLNSIAAALPTVEIALGVLLIVGFARRGIGLAFAVMLIAFSLAIHDRGVALATAGGQPLCEIAFDCGCGTGVEKVCVKLAQNAGLLFASLWLVFAPASRWSWRERLIGAR